MSSRLEGEFDNLPMSQIQPGSFVMKKFQDIKESFDGKGERTWHFDLDFDPPGGNLALSNQRRRRVILRSQDIRGFYEPVVSSIFNLLLSQIGAANGRCGRDVINVSDFHSCFVEYM